MKTKEDRAMFERLLYSYLDKIPGDEGWWKQETQASFRRAGQKLLAAGMKIEVIVPLFHSLYWAVAGEFGG